MTDFPEQFLERMRHLLGSDYAAFAASLAEPAVTGLRVNTLKLSAQAFSQLSPFKLEPVPWAEAGFWLPGEDQPGKHPYYAAGLYYIQDPSAMAVAGILAPCPGERVLDLSAAPGGKSTDLAARLQAGGLLVANEIHPGRAWELAENLERWGVRNATILQETPQRLADHFGAFFDRVLVDAPCSGEGMFRKSPAARAEWSPGLVHSCAARQAAILKTAARLVKAGGWLVYSTCTFAPEENEAVIWGFLKAHPRFELAETVPLGGQSPGQPQWAAGLAGGPPPLERCVRLWPHRLVGEGHFAALLHCLDAPAAPRQARAKPAPRPPAEALRLLRRFGQESLAAPLDEERLALHGTYLYRLPDPALNLDGLRLVHPGWWLGEIKTGRFEPAHALAMGLTASEAARLYPLATDMPETRAYLGGEMLPAANEDGWTLVVVDGYPLGWGKAVQGRLKNFYPRGLRRA